MTEFHVQLVTTMFGSKANPQYGIVGAQYSANWTSLKFSCSNTKDCSSSSSKKAFTLKSSVTFVPLSGVNPQSQLPPIPRLAPPLPGDLFYPFQLNV
jgi:hypothetical protein